MDEKQRLMIKIANLYYQTGLTQDEISRNLRLSRPRVSRLMQEAINKGIVKITITQEPGSYAELENQLEKKYHLLEVIIANTSYPNSTASVARDIGTVAANYFHRIVMDGDVIGLTWGITLAAMVENLHAEKKPNCIVLQMVGGLGEQKSETHATGLVSRTAMALGAGISLLPAPGIVDSYESARLLTSDRAISHAINIASSADIAFVGIGKMSKESLLIRDGSIISWSEMEDLSRQGAVGDISLRYYDIQGELIQSPLNDRVIGISLDDLKKIKRVIGVAGGVDKIKAIQGAIHGRLINSLITDSQTAQRLLDDEE